MKPLFFMFLGGAGVFVLGLLNLPAAWSVLSGYVWGVALTLIIFWSN